MTGTQQWTEPFLTELDGGPLDGTRWIFNHDDDVPTMDPNAQWVCRPERQTWPLPDTIPVDGHNGCYRKGGESQMPAQGPDSHVVRGAYYVWEDST